MTTKPLSETNPYLQNRKTREGLLDRSAISSCGVEGVRVDLNQNPKIHIPRRGNKRIYKSHYSSQKT